MLAFNAVTGKFTESKLVRVIADLLETEAAADSLKVSVVGVRERLCKGHMRASTQRDGFLRG